MLRLIKYLKPYTLLIILTIVLLFAQANAELALPDYLSQIVNTGIQQNGVEDAVPEAIRESQMERLFIFMNVEEKALVLENYILVEPDSLEVDQYLEKYPALAEEPIYVLQDTYSKRLIRQKSIY
jgi:ATP-binding cassette subfamily B protein